MLHLFMVYPEIITSRQVDEYTSGRDTSRRVEYFVFSHIYPHTLTPTLTTESPINRAFQAESEGVRVKKEKLFFIENGETLLNYIP